MDDFHQRFHGFGDLPDDIGTDHNQLVDVVDKRVSIDPVPGQRPAQKRVVVPGWAKWLLNIITPHLFGSLNYTSRTLVIGTDSEQLSPGHERRRYLFIQNLSIGSLYINFDNQAGVNQGILLTAGAAYEPFRVPRNAIYIAGSAADLPLIFIEG